MKAPGLIVAKIIELSGVIAVIILIAMASLVSLDVFLRFVFRRAIHGSMEYVVIMLVCLVYLGIGLCTLQGRHINVDIIYSRLARKGRLILSIFNYLIVLTVCLLYISQGFNQAMFLRNLDIRTSTVGIPHYPFVLLVVFGILLMFFAVLMRLFNVKKDLDREDNDDLTNLKG